MFNKLSLVGNRIQINGLTFYLGNKERSLPYTDGFVLEKSTRLIEQYKTIWLSKKADDFKNIMELGIYGGGSIAFWNELLEPEKFTAIDLAKTGTTPYFNKYLKSKELEQKLKIYWETNQANIQTLNNIIKKEYHAPLDLIIDDASHLYKETKISFEALFPKLRPGGLYIIEDWSWGCWPDLPLDFLPYGTELPKLINEITDAVGSMQRFLNDADNPRLRTLKPLIANVTCYSDVVVIERGNAKWENNHEFRLNDYITFRAQPSLLQRGIMNSCQLASRIVKLFKIK